MKKVILAVLLSALSFGIKAQTFGIKGGANFSNMSFRDVENKKFITKKGENFLVGYHIGLTGGINFHKNFGFEGGIILNTKGKVLSKVAFLKNEIEVQRDMLYLDVPVYAKFMFEVAPKVKVYGKIGPYFGIGLTAKDQVVVYSESGEKIEVSSTILKAAGFERLSKIEWGSDSLETKQMDYGIHMGAGVEVGGFLVEGTYQFSLGDIDNLEIRNTKHHVLSLSVGFNLGF